MRSSISEPYYPFPLRPHEGDPSNMPAGDCGYYNPQDHRESGIRAAGERAIARIDALKASDPDAWAGECRRSYARLRRMFERNGLTWPYASGSRVNAMLVEPGVVPIRGRC